MWVFTPFYLPPPQKKLSDTAVQFCDANRSDGPPWGGDNKWQQGSVANKDSAWERFRCGHIWLRYASFLRKPRSEEIRWDVSFVLKALESVCGYRERIGKNLCAQGSEHTIPFPYYLP